MENHLFITKAQADAVRGLYGRYSAIEPIPLPDGRYFVPERCMNDPDLIDALSTLQTMDDDKQIIEDLPTVGEPCYSGRTYNYSSDAVVSGYSQFVICRQDHNRTIYEPYETPALFTFTRPNADTVLDWILNEYVYLGWQRTYSGNTYQVLQEHMTQETWNPIATLGVLWSTVVVGDAWAAGVAYIVNQEVTYGGHTYKCLQAHTSQIGWEPPNVPALWEFIS